MPTPVPVQSTKFLNSKGRRIFISASGVPFAKTADGKRVYRVKAMSVSNNNGKRKLRPSNVRALPSAIRPARALTKTKIPVKKSPATKMANTMFRAAVRNAKKQGYNARDNESIGMRTRKTAGKATLKARRNESKGVRKALGKSPYADRGMRVRKVRKNKGVARGAYGPQQGREQRRMNAAANKMAAKRAAGPRARKVRKNKGVARKTNSQWAANIFARLVNEPARKTRKNKGAQRNLIASPGGTVYKGMAALTRKLKKMNLKA